VYGKFICLPAEELSRFYLFSFLVQSTLRLSDILTPVLASLSISTRLYSLPLCYGSYLVSPAPTRCPQITPFFVICWKPLASLSSLFLLRIVYRSPIFSRRVKRPISFRSEPLDSYVASPATSPLIGVFSLSFNCVISPPRDLPIFAPLHTKPL